jgi:hypothetical protein
LDISLFGFFINSLNINNFTYLNLILLICFNIFNISILGYFLNLEIV